ncbi:Uncharacterised protein [uncultured archaeon]|nr:Uncharacterised protein [uncultured archaeon]
MINKYIKGFFFVLVMMSVALIVMAAPPAIVITQPSADNETVKGSFQFVAHITNPVENLNRVEFIITNTTGTVGSSFTNPNRNTSSSGEDFTYTLNTAELADGSYMLTVNAINEDITSPNSTTATRNFVINNIPPPNNPPTVPTPNTHANYHNSESTTVSWGASTDSDGDSITYDVKVGTSSGGIDVVNQIGNGKSGSTSSTSSNTFTMAPTNTYYWSVRACDGFGCSAWSESSFGFYNNAPVQDKIGDKTVVEGDLLTFTVHATDADSDQITYSTDAKGTLNSTTGVYSWQTSTGDAGTYVWYFNSSDNYGGIASETIKVTVNEPLKITSYTPTTPVIDHVGATRSFDITFNQVADVNWYINGFQVQTNPGVASASYTNTSAKAGTWNVTVSASNTNGSVSYTWTWIVNDYTPSPPTNIQNNTYNFGVNWNWTKGANSDFTEVSVDGVFKENRSDNIYNFTEGKPHGTHTIQLREYNSTQGIYSDWTNQTTIIPNNLPVQAHIGNRTVYKGQLLTFSVNATDADSDTIRYGTNANRGSFDSNTGTYAWTPGDGDAGVYVWEFNSSDSYGGIARETITVEVKNPLDLDLRLLEPIVVMDENGTSVGIWQDARVGHIGKLIGYNSTFKNAADVRLVLNVTEIGNNATNDTYKVTLGQNESKSCPDGISICRVKFEIGPEGVRDGFFNFTLKIDVNGYMDQTPVFNYTNLTTVYLPIIPVFKIKQSDAAIAIVSEGRTTTITYVLEANGTVNMTNISVFDPLYPQKYFNISRYEVSGNTSRCYNEEQNQIPCSMSYKYPATIGALSRFKSEESEMGYPYIINMATFSAKNESGYPINDTDYVEICVNKCWKGSIPIEGTVSRGGGSSGGGGGGGGMAPSEDINNIERREVREMDILSRTASTYIFRSADPVMVVAFESSVSENGVPVAVEVLKNRSKNIKEDAPGKLYKYFNVFVGTSGFSQKVSNGVIAYRVNNSWLAENNIDPADISLYKWRGTWVKLDTEIAENRSNYTYYASLTGNFSSFAIAAAKEQKIGGEMSVPDMPASPDQQNTTQAIANLSADESKHKIPGLSAAVILVFGIAGVIFYLKRNHKKFNRDVRK